MTIIGVISHIKTLMRKIEYKLFYGKRIQFSKFGCRSNFRVIVDKNAELYIGEGCFFNNNCSINCLNKISIGKNSIFGENVKIYDHNHHISENTKLIKNQGFSLGEVVIGENCWICSNVIILKGCRIGNNVVIGAGCIIKEEIPDNTIVTLKNELEIKERITE